MDYMWAKKSILVINYHIGHFFTLLRVLPLAMIFLSNRAINSYRGSCTHHTNDRLVFQVFLLKSRILLCSATPYNIC